jgi:hypothetical protein
MYVTTKMLAEREGCSVKTIDRIRLRMERSGLYPNAVKRTGTIKIRTEDFDDYVLRERREQWKK